MTWHLKFQGAALAASLLWSMAAAADAHVYWQDDFNSADFRGWSYAQGADPRQGGPGPQFCYVTDFESAQIPPLDGLQYVAHFERPASAVNQKSAMVQKEWSNVGKKDQFRRVEDKIFNGGNVSAQYSAWYYFPANYTVPAGLPASGWVNIFEFKEEGNLNPGDAVTQNPSWWINVSAADTWYPGSGSAPYLFVNDWGNQYGNSYIPKVMPVPRGRWFEIRAKLYSGDRIEWYVDGKLFDTSHNSTYPVGRFYQNSNGWIFGLGHNQGIGSIYIDHVQVSDFSP